MFVRRVINLLAFKEIHQAPVIPLGSGDDITFDAVLACNFRRLFFQGDLPDFGRDGVLGDVAERSGHRGDKFVKKGFGIVRPHMAGFLHIIVLPVELGFSVGLRQHLQEFTEHKIPADRHQTNEDKGPESNKPHKQGVVQNSSPRNLCIPARGQV